MGAPIREDCTCPLCTRQEDHRLREFLAEIAYRLKDPDD